MPALPPDTNMGDARSQFGLKAPLHEYNSRRRAIRPRLARPTNVVINRLGLSSRSAGEWAGNLFEHAREALRPVSALFVDYAIDQDQQRAAPRSPYFAGFRAIERCESQHLLIDIIGMHQFRQRHDAQQTPLMDFALFSRQFAEHLYDRCSDEPTRCDCQPGRTQ